jgi:ribosomal protein S18 acetylase RimI-like enzyme
LSSTAARAARIGEIRLYVDGVTRWRLELLTEADGVLALTDQLAAVYRSAFGSPEYAETEDDVRRFAAEQLPAHVRRPGFRIAVAVADGGEVVGFAYGYRGERGQWWAEHVAELAPAEIVAEWLRQGGHFELVELAVATSAQRQGVGQGLHDLLLTDLPHGRALLTTHRRDLPAPRLYRRSGWELLMDALDEHSSLYGLRLPYRSSPRRADRGAGPSGAGRA